MAFMPLPVCRVEPRSAPTARSGCVTRPTTGSGPASRASKVGSANRPVPIMTRRMLRPSLSGSQNGRLQRRQFLLDLRVRRDLALLLGLAVVVLEGTQLVAGGQLGHLAEL